MSLLAPFVNPTIPPLLSPVFHLVFTALTLPILTFTFLTALSPAQVVPLPSLSLSSSPASRYVSKQTGTLGAASTPSPMPSPAVSPHFRLRTRNFFLFLLCAQISALVYFAFQISMLVLLPGQTVLAATPTGKEIQMGVWTEALVFRAVQTVFIVLWTVCVMSAFFRTCLFQRLTRRMVTYFV